MTALMFTRIDPDLTLEVWPDFPESEVCSGTRASIGRLLVDDPKSGLKVGLWEAEANLGRWVNWPCDEFMVILEGEVVMVEADHETVVGAGECFFIPKGRRCIWNQAGYVKKIMVLFDAGPGDPDRAIGKVDPSTLLSPLVSAPGNPPPQQSGAEVFRDSSGRMRVGVWRSASYSRPDTVSPNTEVMNILAGEVTLRAPDGTSQRFGPGDTLLVPAKASLASSSLAGVHMIQCTCEPAP